MPNSKIILTKTNRANATPHPNDLDYGELAINYEDGLLFFKNNSGRISKIASSGSFTTLTKHVADRENPHNVNKAQVGLENVDNSSDLDKPISTATQTALDAKVNSTHLTSNYYNQGATDTQIQNKFNSIVINVSTPTASNPNGFLTYQKSNNTFNYTQPTIPTLSDLGGVGVDDISVDAAIPSLGRGTLSYGGSGIFIYDQPTIGGLGGYAKTEIGLNYKTSGDSDGTLTYNDGFFLYDQPTIGGITQGKITLIDGVLDVEGYVTDAELANFVTKEGQDVEGLQAQITSNETDIKDHVDSRDNPHNVTATQIGLGNVEDKSAATIIGEIVDSDIPSTITRDSELNAHTSLQNNPHSVTKTQVGLSNVENKSAATIIGEIVDSDIPSTIARDSELNTKVTNLGAVTGIQQLTQAAYDALTPDASTVYIIVD